MIYNSIQIQTLLFSYVLIFSFVTQFVEDDSCNSTDFQIISIAIGKHDIKVYGETIEVNNNDFFIMSPQVIDCTNKRILLNFDYSEIMPFSYEIKNDTLVLISYTLILVGDNWKYEEVPETQYSISQDIDTLRIEENHVFDVPILSEKQNRDIDSLICFLDSSKDEKIKNYPGDEKSLYMLDMAALNNYKNTFDLLSKIEELFLFDGALKETLGELKYMYCKKNK